MKTQLDQSMLIERDNLIFQIYLLPIFIQFSNLPPSQGGRYSGFGYSANPSKSNVDSAFDSWSSFQTVSLLKQFLTYIKKM